MDSMLPWLSRALEGRSQLPPGLQLVRAAPTEPLCTNTTWTHPQLNDPAPSTGTVLGQSRRSAPNPQPGAHTAQTNGVTAEDGALRALSPADFKCSCKTRSLLILGTAEERCLKQSCQSVQSSSRRWREKRKQVQRHRWQGRKRRERGKGKK